MNSFSSLSLSPALLQSLESLEYRQPTPIQVQSLPPMLLGRDVIAQARTGSGKTAAYGLGLLSRIDPGLRKIQALVICPTHELADQVAKEIRRLARCMPNIKLMTLSGGISMRPQLASLSHEPQVIVGTAGRIQDHLHKHGLSLGSLKVLVLDEADKMLDMGFEAQLSAIVEKTPADRQTLMFSATYPKAVRKISRQIQREAIEITLESSADIQAIEQLFFDVEPGRKVDAIVALLNLYNPDSAVVFCHTKIDTRAVTSELASRHFSVLALHGDIEQRDRDEVLVRFANKSCRVLVATDVAARGLDIKDLSMVISHELPSDPEVHVHRVGRTGRAGNTGIALSLCAAREQTRVAAIQKLYEQPLRWQSLNLAEARGKRPQAAAMSTLCVDGGRQDKVRPGDILGALTGEAGLAGVDVGKINTFETRTYVAIRHERADQAFKALSAGKIKGRNFRVRKIG